ncbi:class I SAM-dependent DNA methyltransferase [Aliiruegeria sabulilitoris]|uniref:class I SAM-dependent DNA methyltransferase n=1 Tax=Aliiruegeria sabulilitoris TaxID=1510458 RepID=UPI00082B2009|nr:class I SAM-dependent methyltransferase [Aliiruegeria sabulilitoris]NDR56443.1 class I SAM-dependent methyltransferase [Pseudoruegeria sp. M32A2M]
MCQNCPSPEEILATYEAVGPQWAAERSQALFERGWLQRFVEIAPGREILDIGCGSGQPIATWLARARQRVTGVDGAAAQCALFARNQPGRAVHHCDMRGMALGQRFDGLIAWDSFFHLSPEAQRGMFPIFANHARPGAALLFTSGPSASIAYGSVAGVPVYHASLDPEEYRALLGAAGFAVLDFVPEDPDCERHSVWLARYAGEATDV